MATGRITAHLIVRWIENNQLNKLIAASGKLMTLGSFDVISLLTLDSNIVVEVPFEANAIIAHLDIPHPHSMVPTAAAGIRRL